MGWLMHNPIADMYGPTFLLFYGCVIVATLVACWWAIRAADPTVSQLPLPLPSNPDPYDIAYLRGGANEVIRLAVFNLMQRGYLKVQERERGTANQKLVKEANHPESRHLSPIERKVFEYVISPGNAPVDAASLFVTLPVRLKQDCQIYEERMRQAELLSSPQLQETARRVALMGGCFIATLGGYKLIVALAKGKSNVVFLLIMAVVALVVLIRVCRPPRLSHLGKDYLKRLQEVFRRLKYQAALPNAEGLDTTMLLLVSVFGLSVLADSAYANFERMFHKGATSSGSGGCGGGYTGSGGCGGSSAGCGGGGSSGCGGGGGGGGCGGCGGGGCGG